MDALVGLGRTNWTWPLLSELMVTLHTGWVASGTATLLDLGSPEFGPESGLSLLFLRVMRSQSKDMIGLGDI